MINLAAHLFAERQTVMGRFALPAESVTGAADLLLIPPARTTERSHAQPPKTRTPVTTLRFEDFSASKKHLSKNPGGILQIWWRWRAEGYVLFGGAVTPTEWRDEWRPVSSLESISVTWQPGWAMIQSHSQAMAGLHCNAVVSRPKGLAGAVAADGGRDCLSAGDACSGDDACSPRLRTLRQCVAGDGSVKLGPGARNQCENAMTALLSTPLHGCQCKRGMKKEKNCLSIYWSLQQAVLHGLSLVEDFPYEPEERGSDYVRLASIAAESEATTVNRCLDAAKACNIDETCQKLRTEYVSSCIRPSARSGPCNRPKCNKALRKFFDRVPPDYTHELLFCPCTDTACAERRRRTVVPACSYEDKDEPGCLAQLRLCKADYVCRSRWAQFQYDCQPWPESSSGCKQANHAACLLAYTGLIGSTITPNYLDNSTSNVGPRCSCATGGHQREQCASFLASFHDNVCLKKAISAFGNSSDVKTGGGIPSPAATRATGVPGVSVETAQNILRAEIPTQVNGNERLWDDSTPPSSPDLFERNAGATPVRPVPPLATCWLFLLLGRR
ncbi:GDNF family receptor alpha-4a isoform X2 [Phyllopteryx taeniolatus]|uniref:GDNF family receptor alpha-4a isoform X2 n=1 Tax=Phyllopteryx taeniolatus TaxID=161469 RepID=UPI002AD262E5|nr:GDNF family receptor alpha-4a isoform X2 [Phyllopteryx taeniolatus]